jgi:hypothetical protein
MTRRLTLGLSIALMLGTAGCQDQSTAPVALPSTDDAATSPLLKQTRIQRGRLELPRGVRIADGRWPDLTRRAIDPNDHVCPAEPPPSFAWFEDQVQEIIDREPQVFDLLYNELWADLVPFWESLFLLTERRGQEFGFDGDFTNALVRTHRDAQRFWDIQSDDIQLIALKGTMLLDVARVARIYEMPEVPPFFGLSEEDAHTVATLVRNTVLQSETLDRGDHPLFSLNAFASPGDPSAPPRIVMGDGLLEAYAAVGLGDVAPQTIYGHEFGHHIQFQNGYFEEDEIPGATTDAEFTRYFELMADAYSTYFLTHKRGAAMNRKRVEQFLETSYQAGDCGFDDPSHHGTPNQRRRAAAFGFAIAARAQKQGHILTSDQFHDLFVAAYPGIVAPDAT